MGASDDELSVLLGGIYDNLPSNKTEAFVLLEHRLRSYYRIHKQEFRFRDYLTYLHAVKEMISECGLGYDYKKQFEDVGVQLDEDRFIGYLAIIDSIVLRLKMSLSRSKNDEVTDIVQLDEDSKIEIRSLVDTVKIKLSKMSIDGTKRDILYSKLNTFLTELDQVNTRLTAFLSSMVQVAGATGKAAEELEPVVGLFERIMKAIGRGSREQPKLPKWEEPKQLPSPDSFNGSEGQVDGAPRGNAE